jgi:NDP-sugar pyrophosphorylase family protein
MGDLSSMDVVVLAGGQGSRLRTLFPDLPKLLVPVAGRPFISYLLAQLDRYKARRVVLALGYLADRVQDHLERRGPIADLEVVTRVESAPMGTGGALASVMFDVNASEVLVMNGDSFADIDLGALVDYHREQDTDVTLALVKVADARRFGLVTLDAAGRLDRFLEKPDKPVAGLINSGIYVMRRSFITELPRERPLSLEQTVLPALSGKAAAFVSEGKFIDIGIPTSYLEAQTFFMNLPAL